jgi:hypothetical protein
MGMHIHKLSLIKNLGRAAEGGFDKFSPMVSALVKEYEAKSRDATDVKSQVQYREQAKVLSQLNDQFLHLTTGAEVSSMTDVKALGELVSLMSTMVLNQPKSVLLNVAGIGMGFPLAMKGIHGYSIGAIYDAIKTLGSSVWGGLFGDLKGFADSLPENEKWVAELLLQIDERSLPFKTYMADVGHKGSYDQGGLGANFVKYSRKIKRFMNVAGPVPIVGNIFAYSARHLNHAIAVANVRAYVKMTEKLLQHDLNNPNHLAAGMSPEVFEAFSARVSEYLNKPLKLWLHELKANDGKPTKADIVALVMMAENEVSMNADINSRPAWVIDPKTQHLTTFWGWPLRQVLNVHKSFQNEQGEFQWKLAHKMVLNMVYLVGLGVGWSLLMDGYDELFRGKKSSALPISDKNTAAENAVAVLERMSKTGVYGMAGEAITGLATFKDSMSGNKGMSLDERVLAFSLWKSMYTAMSAAIQQENVNYESVWRPIVHSLGGNGVIQYVQMFNNAIGGIPDSTIRGTWLEKEMVVVDRQNVKTILRTAGRENDVALRRGGGSQSPTPISFHTRRMEMAMYANDAQEFMKAYKDALAVALEKADAVGRKASLKEAQDAVHGSWRSRSPLNVFGSSQEAKANMHRMEESMSDSSKLLVRQTLQDYERFGVMIGVGRGRSSSSTPKTTPSAFGVGFGGASSFGGGFGNSKTSAFGGGF